MHRDRAEEENNSTIRRMVLFAQTGMYVLLSGYHIFNVAGKSRKCRAKQESCKKNSVR